MSNNITNQMELTLANTRTAARLSGSHRAQPRMARAAYWFARMRQAVDNAPVGAANPLRLARGNG